MRIENPPRKFKLACHDVTIERWDPMEAMSRRCAGEWRAPELKLSLDVSGRSTCVATTFMHELKHAIWWAYGIEEGDSEERIVEVEATGLSQVFRDNPELVEWWLKLLRGGESFRSAGAASTARQTSGQDLIEGSSARGVRAGGMIEHEGREMSERERTAEESPKVVELPSFASLVAMPVDEAAREATLRMIAERETRDNRIRNVVADGARELTDINRDAADYALVLNQKDYETLSRHPDVESLPGGAALRFQGFIVGRSDGNEPPYLKKRGRS